MMVNAQEEVGEVSGLHTDSLHTPTDTQPSSSKPQKKIKPKRKQRQETKVHSPSSEIPIEESILTPSNDPLPSEEANIGQVKEIAKLKKSVKKLEKRKKSRPPGPRRLKKGRSIEDIDQDAKIALVDKGQGRMHDADMFGFDDLEGNEVIVDVGEKTVEKEVSTADLVTTASEVVTAASVEDSVAPTTATTADVDDELTLAKTLIAIKASKLKVISTAITTPRAKGIVFHEQVQAHIPTISSSNDKRKAKMIEPEKPLKKKDQIALDEEAIIDADRQLAEQIQAQEREHLSIEERSKLLAELIESRRKYFATKRAEEIKNKPPQRHSKKKIFDKVYKRVNTFVDMDTENVEESLKKTQAEGSSKKSGQELEQESAKKQKLTEQEQAKVANDDSVKLKRCLEMVPEDDDVAIKATPLSSKSPIIVDYKIYIKGKKSYFKIIRADGNS
nr:hypothetical protein [Tanacetum cinerariifolium]